MYMYVYVCVCITCSADTIVFYYYFILFVLYFSDDIKLNVTQVAGQLDIQWRNVFTSPGPLYYEVSVGTQLGSSSIRKLVTTDNNFIQINEPEITQSGVYFLSIRAISYAGFYTHSNYMIDNEMSVKV